MSLKRHTPSILLLTAILISFAALPHPGARAQSPVDTPPDLQLEAQLPPEQAPSPEDWARAAAIQATRDQAAAVAAGPTTLYVATSGNDAATGTTDRPLRTVQAAVDRAGPGTTIVVRAGVYREQVRIAKSGTADSPITLLGDPGATIDGSVAFSGWSAAPEVGPEVYKLSDPPFAPANMTWNGKYLLQIRDEQMADGDGFTDLRSGPEGSNCPDCQSYRSWEGVEGMFGVRAGVLYVRLPGGRDPSREALGFAAPLTGALMVQDASYIVIRGLTMINGWNALLLSNAQYVTAESNVMRGGLSSVGLWNGAANNQIRSNSITLDYVHTLSPFDERHWFIWTVFRVTSVGPRYAISLYQVGDNNVIARNYVFEHFGGIVDRGGSTSHPRSPSQLLEEVRYSRNLRVQGNVLSTIANSALSIASGAVNQEWSGNAVVNAFDGIRLHHPAAGPLYIYDNRIARSASRQLYHDTATNAKIYVYHNSFSGEQGFMFGYETQDGVSGSPNTWYLNNLVSTETLGIVSKGNAPAFDYNWVGGSASREGFMGPGNVFASGKRLWDPDDTVLAAPPAGAVSVRGIDLSRTWQLPGRASQSPLPGVTARSGGSQSVSIGPLSPPPSPGGVAMPNRVYMPLVRKR